MILYDVIIIHNVVLHALAWLHKKYTYNEQQCIIILMAGMHACLHLYGELIITCTKVIVCIPFLKISACKINYLCSHLLNNTAWNVISL